MAVKEKTPPSNLNLSQHTTSGHFYKSTEKKKRVKLNKKKRSKSGNGKMNIVYRNYFVLLL